MFRMMKSCISLREECDSDQGTDPLSSRMGLLCQDTSSRVPGRCLILGSPTPLGKLSCYRTVDVFYQRPLDGSWALLGFFGGGAVCDTM